MNTRLHMMDVEDWYGMQLKDINTMHGHGKQVRMDRQEGGGEWNITLSFKETQLVVYWIYAMVE